MSKRQRIRKAVQNFMLLLFPLIFIFFSPYVIVHGAALGVVNASTLMFTLMFLTSIVAGRFFCGWLCSGGRLQDIMAEAQPRKWNSPWRNRVKFILWVVWFTAIILLYRSHPKLVFDFWHLAELKPDVVAMYFAVVFFVFGFSLLTGKRAMCHSLCWMAPFMILGSRLGNVFCISRLRLSSDRNQCTRCGRCEARCPMSLPVKEMVLSGRMDNSECIACFECVDICPKKNIRFSISRNIQ